MTELTPELQRVRDYFLREVPRLDPACSHLLAPGLLPAQRVFRMDDLRRHLNNPFLNPAFIQFYENGKPVDLSGTVVFKTVQRRQLPFINRAVLQQMLERGAACVLEGVDILEPHVNAFAASMDRAYPCAFANAVAFFSQRGREAYRGHFDSDDVLVIHLGGEKKWRVYRRLAPRRTENFDLPESALGELEREFVMREGDVLYLRSGTPHRVETTGEYSLHMAFDLCDRTVNVEQALQLLVRHYDRDSVRPYGETARALEKLHALSGSEAFGADLAAMQEQQKSSFEAFRRLVDANRVSFFDRLVAP